MTARAASPPPTRGTSASSGTSGRIGDSGDFDTAPADGVRPWFCPGRGPELSHRIAKRIGAARRRVRIATPLLTAGPILGTLAEVIEEDRVDVAGRLRRDAGPPGLRPVGGQPASRWKGPLLARCLVAFHGKRSTPYAPGAVHDYMHAKVTVADDVVFLGSFNLSRSGEMNAENVLEIADAALADRMAAWIDEQRARFEPVRRRGTSQRLRPHPGTACRAGKEPPPARV